MEGLRGGEPTYGTGITIIKLWSVSSRRGAYAPEQISMCINLILHKLCTNNVARVSEGRRGGAGRG